MALVVQKYGGSSVADADGIKRVAQRIVSTLKAGHSVVVVVSAMGDTTDELHDLAAVAADLIHGLQHYEAGRSLEALWWWQYSYVNHWGTHGGAALRALHAIVAHALLDVAEEATPG